MGAVRSGRARKWGGRGTGELTGEEDVEASSLDARSPVDNVTIIVESMLEQDVLPERGRDLITGLT